IFPELCKLRESACISVDYGYSQSIRHSENVTRMGVTTYYAKLREQNQIRTALVGPSTHLWLKHAITDRINFFEYELFERESPYDKENRAILLKREMIQMYGLPTDLGLG
ncbi:hypothetical protein PFISCL1PPCAC_2529, partial [Pristionchus fissidentatus]